MFIHNPPQGTSTRPTGAPRFRLKKNQMEIYAGEVTSHCTVSNKDPLTRTGL